MTLGRATPYYLTGTKCWLSEYTANRLAEMRTPAIAVDDGDGTWSVWFLSETPRVSGQPLLRRPERAYKLYKGVA